MTESQGDGLVRPLNAPSGQQALPGIQPGVSGAVVTAQYVIIFSQPGAQSGGMFVYSGSPGPGNPPVFSVSNATEDPYGNAIAPGIWAGQFGGQQAGLEVIGALGQLAFPTGLAVALAGGADSRLSGNGLGTITQFYSTQDAAGGGAGSDRVFMQMQDYLANGSSATWFLVYQDDTGAAHDQAAGSWAGVTLNTVGTIVAVQPGTGTSSANVAVNETWHTAALAAGWAASGGVAGLFYRLVPDGTFAGTVEVIADIINATATGNSVCFTLPAGYRPAAGQNHPAAWNDVLASNSPSIPWVNVSTGGAIQVTGIEVANKEIFFHIFIPLSAL
jgi:hypothetical protein